MVKQIGGITLKGEEEALYTSKSRSNNKSPIKYGYKNGDKERSHQENAQPSRAQNNINNNSSQEMRFVLEEFDYVNIFK